jgi:hypothetical protein
MNYKINVHDAGGIIVNPSGLPGSDAILNNDFKSVAYTIEAEYIGIEYDKYHDYNSYPGMLFEVKR